MYKKIIKIKLTKKCKNCKKNFSTYSKKQLFCNINCNILYFRSKRIGKKSPIKYYGQFKKEYFLYDRYCLRCDKKFKASGKFNRICPDCKRLNDFNDGGLQNEQ